jgi:hypothetical protein
LRKNDRMDVERIIDEIGQLRSTADFTVHRAFL